jgi:regulatory protein
VAHELRAKGVADEAIAAAFRAAGEDGAADLPRVWGTRFSALPSNDRERARQVRFLQGRGFAIEAILRFLKAQSAT